MSDHTLKELETTPHVIAAASAPAAAAARDLPPGHVLVVTDEATGRPLGLLPADQAAALGQMPGLLRDHVALLQPPTLVAPDLPVAEVVTAMRYDKFIRWIVLIEAGHVTGVVAPETLFALTRDVELLAKDVHLMAAVYGDPLTDPSGLCYLCTGDPAHYVRPADIEDRTAAGRSLCPCDGALMDATYLCPTEMPPC